MKTNVNIPREMGDFEILQRTKDGYFNATSLLKQWNKYVDNQKDILKPQNSGYLKKKDLEDYFNNKSTNEFIETIMKKESLKERNSVLIASRGKYNGGTWMHPLLFIDFAMWLNPTFKVKVLRFVYDELIKYRNDAGDTYIELAKAVKSITPVGQSVSAHISYVAKAVNYIVYGDHQKNLRNKVGEEDKMKELVELQKDITKLLNKKFIKSFKELQNYLRSEYRERHEPKLLSS